MILYIKKVSGKETKEDRLTLLAESFCRYALEKGIPAKEEEFLASLSKNETGKPVSKLVHFNISHSREYWCVLFSGKPCGVDIQYKETRDYEKVTARFFSEQEQKLVAQGGSEMFYRVWTRKESYVKFLGCGFHRGYSHCDMADEKGLLAEKNGGFFQEITGPEGYGIALCSEDQTPVRIEEF